MENSPDFNLKYDESGTNPATSGVPSIYVRNQKDPQVRFNRLWSQRGAPFARAVILSAITPYGREEWSAHLVDADDWYHSRCARGKYVGQLQQHWWQICTARWRCDGIFCNCPRTLNDGDSGRDRLVCDWVRNYRFCFRGELHALPLAEADVITSSCNPLDTLDLWQLLSCSIFL